MEGSQAEQQQQQATGAPGSARWLGFAAWLRQQAGGPLEEAVSEASASDAEEADLPHAPADHQQHGQQVHAANSSHSSSAGGRVPSIPAATPPAAAAAAHGHQLARHATLAPRLPDCRAETRMTSDSSSRARQEMTVMLAAPGMPLHQAPLLTAKQASALMAAICEPLLSLPVGRLTRKLSAPTKLQPTEDRGVLSLWLLPDDSLSLVWQSAQQLGSEAVEEAVSSAAAAAAFSGASSTSGAACPASHSSSSSCPAGGASTSGGCDPGCAGSRHSSGSSATRLPPLQQSCSVGMWEELAHFPAQAHLLDDAPVVTIHMLRGDASGRSFYIRVRSDVAEANLEAATAAVPDASRMLQQQRAAAAMGAVPGALPEAATEPPAGAPPRMYFWLADRDIGKAVYSLGRLKSLLKRPPTLSKRSGVPEHQLAQLGAWVQRADAAAAKQQQRATAAAAEGAQQAPPQQQLGAAAWPPEDVQQQQPQEQQLERRASRIDSGAAVAHAQGVASGAPTMPASGSQGSSARTAAPLMPLLGGPGSSGLLLGQPGSVSPTPHVQGSMAALLPSPLLTHQQQQQQQTSGSGSALAGSSPGSDTQGQGSEPGSPTLVSGTSTVSATAAALYQDHRFNVVCPCTISVVVGMRVQAAGADPAALPAVASARARAVAERQAKAAVDRSGRQRIEERLAEVVIRNIRAQRNRARQARQAQRDSATRLQQAERALALARLATGRGPGPAPPPTPAPGTAPAAAEPAVADAATPASPAGLFPTQPTGREGQPPRGAAHSESPLVLGGETGSCVESDVLPVPSPAQPQGGARALASPVEHPSSPTGQRLDAAFSPTPPLPLPTPLLPGGRVTIGNLQSLLSQPQGMGPSGRGGGQGSGSAELAPAAAATTAAAGAEAGPATGAPSRVTVADLADLLGKHAKLE